MVVQFKVTVNPITVPGTRMSSKCFQPCLLANVVRLGGGWLLRHNSDEESHVTGTSFPPRWSCMLNLLRLSFGISRDAPGHVSS